MKKIELRDVSEDFDAVINIQNMMSDEEGLEMYRNKWQRTQLARYIYEVRRNNQVVGFAYLINDFQDETGNFLGLDIGLKNKEIGKGTGTEILKQIINGDYKEFILGETKKDNERANKIINKTGGILVAENKNINIYLLQGNRLEEFIAANGLEVITQRFSDPKILIKK